MRIALIGHGRMGMMVESLVLAREGWEVAGIVDRGYMTSLDAVENPTVAIDFSHPDFLQDTLAVATRRHIPLVIGTTGLNGAQEAAIRQAAGETPIVWASNFSLGVALMQRVVREMTQALGDAFDIEIVETHHRMKQDAPSGTARMLLQAVDPSGTRPVSYGREGMIGKRGKEIGMHALRGGTVCGEHSVRFLGDMEELEIRHRADSRAIFAAGALRAAMFVVGRTAGLYGMEQVLFQA